MKALYTGLLLMCMSAFVWAQQSQSTELKSQKDKISYGIGVTF